MSLSGWTNYRVCEGPASSRLLRSSSVFSAGSGTLERVDFKAATGRAETFVHGANVDVPFPPLDRGEDGCAAQLVSHDVDDDAGLFLHVEHGANTAPARGDRRADVADLAPATAVEVLEAFELHRSARRAAGSVGLQRMR